MYQRRWVEKPLHPTEGKEVLWLGWIDKPPPITTNSTLSTIWWCYAGSNVYSLTPVDQWTTTIWTFYTCIKSLCGDTEGWPHPSHTLLVLGWCCNLWILCVNKLKSTNIHYVRNIRDCKSITYSCIMHAVRGVLCGYLGSRLELAKINMHVEWINTI